ncbi:MAG TPA: S8 family serine peptidase [Terricaulis sp.]|nr:S8 family serine peptidase [Terricaulis sp.]
MAEVGPLLGRVLTQLEHAGAAQMGAVMSRLEARLGPAAAQGRLPVVVQFEDTPPKPGEAWREYKRRINQHLKRMQPIISDGAQKLYLANALAADLPPQQVRGLASQAEIAARIELDPIIDATLLDNCLADIEQPAFIAANASRGGTGVSVAVLDSGIDESHPFLNVAGSVSTCGEVTAIPGEHGTHCAGAIASQDSVYRGVAPNVKLLNVKVLRANGTGTATFIAQGVDRALDMNADILSMSVGFNHLPTWSQDGHGWSCPRGTCQLCTSVNNAVQFGKLVVAAAGNEHERAAKLRAAGYGSKFDTELACPGQALGAFTVGAITKRAPSPPLHALAGFSSWGPAAYGGDKPDIAAPGVNVTSTVPAPRDPHGALVIPPRRADLFKRLSGTSMATPLVAGAAALLLEALRAKGLASDPATLKARLRASANSTAGWPRHQTGAGWIDMGALGVV